MFGNERKKETIVFRNVGDGFHILENTKQILEVFFTQTWLCSADKSLGLIDCYMVILTNYHSKQNFSEESLSKNSKNTIPSKSIF